MTHPVDRRAKVAPAPEATTTAQVARWLSDHPDFLREHLDVLAALDLPHETGGAVSLIERQVRVLRERNDVLTRQLDTLIACAMENEKLAERVHNFGLRLQLAGDVDAVLDAVTRTLADELSLDAVALRLYAPQNEGERAEYVGVRDAARFLEQVHRLEVSSGGHGRPRCGDREMSPLVVFLFEGRSVKIRSSVLVALRIGTIPAVLAFGSYDTARYTPEMETTFIARLAGVIQAALVRVLP